MSRSLAVVFFGVALFACPPRDQGKAAPADASAPCTKFGQNCEVSPGKLGSCVVKDGCTDGSSACFVCQSQH